MLYPRKGILSALAAVVATAFAPAAFGDWPTFGADAQRSGWAVRETILNRDNAGTLELKWKIRLENAPKELTSLTAPIVVDNVKIPRGIKEYVVVAGSSDTIFAIDADTGKLAWRKSFTVEATPVRQPNALCPFALNATPVAAPTGRPRVVYATSSDGRLHALSMVDGEDRFPPMPFVPPFSKNWSLNIFGGVLYTAAGQRCNATPSGVYSVDLNSPEHTAHSFLSGPAGIWGRAGVAISQSGAVFGETGDGLYHPEVGQLADTIFALSPDLKLTGYYTPANREWLTRKDLDMGSISPVVFRLGGKDYVAGSGKEGRIFLLDAKSPGGADHRTPLYRSELIDNEDGAYAAHGFWGAFASWEDSHAVRWLFAPAWGPPHPAARPFPLANGAAPHGSIMAFRVELKDGAPILSPAWISRDLNVPEPPIIANGVLFALSSGEDVQQVDDAGNSMNTKERLGGSTHAVLYAFDAESGKELFSSGDAISSFTHFGGIALSNGRIFVSTYDGIVYAFGLKNEER
jgi:outer membrane protein assembly factor BamB